MRSIVLVIVAGFWAGSLSGGEAWVDISLSGSSETACGGSLALTASGDPMAVYLREGTDSGLVLATWEVDRWSRELVVPMAGISCHEIVKTEIELDGQSLPRVMLSGGANAYAFKNGSGWSQEPFSLGYPIDMVVDATGVPHVVYLAGVSGCGVATRSGGSWRSVFSSTEAVFDAELCVSSSGARYLNTVVGDGAGPRTTMVWESSGDSYVRVLSTEGYYSSMQIHEGKPWIGKLENGETKIGWFPPDTFQSFNIPSSFITSITPQGSGHQEFPTQFRFDADGHYRFIARNDQDLYKLRYGEENGATEILPYRSANGVIGNGLFVAKNNILFLRNEAPYLFYLDADVHPKLAAKLPTPEPPFPSRTVSSIRWTWPTSSKVTGFRVRRASDSADLSGVLSPDTSAWSMDGLDANHREEVYLETICPGFVLASTPVAATTAVHPPRVEGLSRADNGALTVSWSGGGNPAGTAYRLNFLAPGGESLSQTVANLSTVVSFLSPDVPYALGLSAVSDEGLDSIASHPAWIRRDGSAVLIQFDLGDDVTLQSTFRPADAPFSVTAAGIAEEFPAASDFHGVSTGRGFLWLLDRPLFPTQVVTLTLSYPVGWPGDAADGSLFLSRFDSVRQQWIPQPTSRDGNTLTAFVDGGGLFQVMSRTVPPATLGGAAAYPNPFQPENGAVLSLRELPPGARAKVFSSSGSLLRTLQGSETGFAQWDGRDDAGTMVPSGVYVLSLENGGEHRKMKIMVER